ncbi:hypothetical protein C8Q72DRAFT_344453 [Fomitopsis betulina]|nr:hypothetical protein C8Q72DRAFT_344453 [Fomitopsis betulina]
MRIVLVHIGPQDTLRLETCIFHRGEQHSSRRKRCVCVQVCSSKMYRVHLAVLDRAAQIRPSFPGRTHVVWVHTLSAMHHTRTTQLLGKALTEVISRGSCSQESSVNWCDIQLPRALFNKYMRATHHHCPSHTGLCTRVAFVKTLASISPSTDIPGQDRTAEADRVRRRV